MNSIKRITFLALVGIMNFLLMACSHHASTITAGNACSQDAYLKQYHCSIDKVTTAAKAGDADAQYALGYMYFYGINTSQNTALASHWINRSAAQGQPLALKARDLINQKTHSSATARRVIAMNHSKPNGAIQRHLPQYPNAQQHTAKSFSTLGTKSTSNSTAGNYTVQLAAVSNLQHLKQFINAHDLNGKTRYYPIEHNGQTLYVLVYGNYASRYAADQAIETLPMDLQALHPWVKPIKK